MSVEIMMKSKTMLEDNEGLISLVTLGTHGSPTY